MQLFATWVGTLFQDQRSRSYSTQFFFLFVGIMRTEDLKLLFKDVSFKPEDIKSYIIDLLSKFEVALMWDEHNLLIPSLLPTEQDLRMGLPQMDIRVSKI